MSCAFPLRHRRVYHLWFVGRSQLSSRNEITGWPGGPALYFSVLSLSLTGAPPPPLGAQSTARHLTNTGESSGQLN